jgi:hypothetical protein
MKQPPRRYCQYNNEGTDEIILSLFPAYLLLRIVLLKLQLYRGALPHASPYTTQYLVFAIRK